MKQRRGSISYAGDSPVNQFRQRVDGKLKPIHVGSGRSSLVSSIYYDPITSLWRTFQDSSLEGWDSSSLTFPQSGTMRNGIVCRRLPSVPYIAVTGSSLWPTPRATMSQAVTVKPSTDKAHATGGPPKRLEDEVARSLGPTNGKLNPMWVEWLMGFPLGWTDLED